MRQIFTQADDFRYTVIDKPGTGHSDRPIQPVLRVPCLASEYSIHRANTETHCI